MKTKLFLVTLISCVFLTNCKKKEQPEATQVKPLVKNCISTALPDDKLEFDKDENKIYGIIHLKVASKDFQKAGEIELFEVIQNHNTYHGIAYRYVNSDNTIIDNGDTETMEVKFEFENNQNWAEGECIKIMSLNESNQNAFKDLRPYFEKRLSEYPNIEMSVTQLKDFDTEWNSKHEDTNSRHLRVNTHLDEDDKEKEKFTPKLTKQDMIIRLTKK